MLQSLVVMLQLELAIAKILGKGLVKSDLLTNQIAAISCGILKIKLLPTLIIKKIAPVKLDCNFVLNKDFNLIRNSRHG